MSVVDKIIAKVTPPESDAARRKAHDAARALSRPGDWLSQVLDHHEAIEAAFEEVRTAQGAQRVAAQQRLGALLTGHSSAEEVVLYPAMAQTGHKAAAGLAYTEQTTAKMQMAELENIDPATDAYLDKLGHIRGAVLHHVFEEESTWFPKLAQASDADQAHLTRRYSEEIGRYFATDPLA